MPPPADVIGEGAHSIVYREVQRGRPVALKISRRLATEAGTDERFRREAAALARIQHPGVVNVMEAGRRADGHAYILMEHIEGPTLAQRLAEGPLAESEVTELGVQLCSALAEVHRLGLVHRDLKPANVLLPRDGGHAKLIDFGLVSDRSAERAAQEAVGTFLYAAPEQTGVLKLPVDGRADLYALGVLLFECLTGQPPLSASDAEELIRKHGAERPPRARSLLGEVSQTMDALLDRLLAKDPDDRYPSASALGHDLAALGEGKLAPQDLARQRGLQRQPTELVERQEQMGALVSRVQSAKQGRGSVAVLQGETGIGKTRLARELGVRVHAGGGLCLWSPSAAEAAPLRVFKRCVSSLLTETGQRTPAQASQLRLRIAEAAGEYAPYLAKVFPELRAVLGEVSDVASAGHEIHRDAIAHLFTRLGTPEEPLVLVVEDLDQVDQASLGVLRRLVEELQGAHLVIVVTRRAEASDGAPATAEMLQAEPRLTLELSRLSAAGVTAMAAELLGVEGLGAELAQELIARCHGNPLSVVEHVRAMLDAGALVPEWGSWRIGSDQLATLALPDNVHDLEYARLARLPADAREMLRRAALMGVRFTGPQLASLSEGDTGAVQHALGHGIDAGVLQMLPDGGYAFLQDAARLRLAAELPENVCTRLHRTAGNLLWKEVEQDPEQLFACARHFAAGVDTATAEDACNANTEAGVRALSQHAPEEALAFLEAARKIADEHGVQARPELYGSLADAYAAAGDVDGCLAVTPAAVEVCTDRFERVRLLRRAADLYVVRSEGAAARQLLEQAYHELDRKLPVNSPLQLLGVPWSILEGKVRLWRWRRSGHLESATSERARYFQALTQLTEITNRWAMAQGYMLILVASLFRQFVFGLRSGPSQEQCWAFATHECAFAALGLPEKLGKPYHETALRLAEQSGDRVTLARVHMLHAVALTAFGSMVEGAVGLDKAMTRHLRWLDPADVINLHVYAMMNYGTRGYTVHATKIVRDCIARVKNSARSQSSEVQAFAGLAEALENGFSRPVLAAQQALKAVEESGGPEEVGPWLSAWNQRLVGLLETEDLVQLDAAIEESERCKAAGLAASEYYLSKAKARLAQAFQASPEELPLRIEQLETAAKSMRFMGKSPSQAAHALLFKAAIAHLRGDQKGVVQPLGEAEEIAADQDVPEATYQILLLRAQMARRAGRRQPAARYLRAAHSVATELGWTYRAQRVAAKLSETTQGSAASRAQDFATQTVTHTVVGAGSAKQLRARRDRDALLDLNLDASTVFEPVELARVALDKLVRLLSAERALLLLWEEDVQELQLLAARDTEGQDVAAEGIASGVIEKVRQTRAPVVLSGTGEAGRLGFQQAVDHELRSVICAPLMLREKFTGIVYLDSTVAKGVFDEADLDILRAIANQIAISQQTAKSAQREIERHALEKDLQLTGAVQTLLLPQQDTWVEGELRLCAFYEPVSRAGGDFWFARRLSDGSLMLLVADVTGHGAGSSMVTAAVAGCERALSGAGSSPPSPPELLAEVNRVLLEVCRGAYTMPACILRVAPDGTTDAWSAAAPPVLVQRADGSSEVFSARGLPVGSEDFCAGHTQWTLGKGDRLLACTDGILELELPSGREMGIKRLQTFFAGCTGLGLRESRSRLIEQVRQAQGEKVADDDLTYVMVERTGD